MPWGKGQALLECVFHPGQFQPAGRGGNPQIQPIARLQGTAEAVKGQLSLADAHQSSCNDAHHIVEEGIAVHLQDHFLILSDDGEKINSAYRGLGASAGCGKGGKIMGAQNLLPGYLCK